METIYESDSDAPRRPGVMRGAETGLPDSQRDLELIVTDHATAAWGQIRDHTRLDSAGAVHIISVAMARLLVAANGRKVPADGFDILGRKKSPGRPRASA